MNAPTQSPLRALAERLRTATGQLDDEALGRLICAVKGWTFEFTSIGCGDDGSDEFQLYRLGDHIPEYVESRHLCPDVSIDAALALVRERLPGHHYVLESIGAVDTLYAMTILIDAQDNWPFDKFDAHAPTAPLAILSALLAVLIEQEGGGMKTSTITYAWPDDLWRCPSCRCSSYARMDERGADGHFAPGPGIRCVECKNTFFPPTPTPPDIAALAAQVAEKVLMDVCELPDRTSPADWPEAMLVTGEELDWIVKEHVATALTRLSNDLAREREANRKLSEALAFYRDQWTFHAIGDEGDGVTDMGRLDGYEAAPTNALLKDGGDMARASISQGVIKGELWT